MKTTTNKATDDVTTAASPKALRDLCAEVVATEAARRPVGAVIVTSQRLAAGLNPHRDYTTESITFRACEFGTYAAAKSEAEKMAGVCRVRGDVAVTIAERKKAKATCRWAGTLT